MEYSHYGTLTATKRNKLLIDATNFKKNQDEPQKYLLEVRIVATFVGSSINRKGA